MKDQLILRISCVDPGIFAREGPGQSDKKSSDNVFFFFFFSPQLILQKSNAQFQRNLSFFNVPDSRGGPTFFRGGGGGWRKGPTISSGGPIAYSL